MSLMMNKLYNLFLWLTWRIRKIKTFRWSEHSFIFPPGVFYGGLWWGNRLREGYQIFTEPDDNSVLRCVPKIPPFGGYYYNSDNIHRNFTEGIPFTARIEITYVGRMHPDSWDAFWFYGNDPNEIDVAEIFGDRFSPNIHWGTSKEDKQMLRTKRYKLPKGTTFSFGVKADMKRIKFYCNDVLVMVTKTPEKFKHERFRTIIGVGSKTIEPIEPRNTMVVNKIEIGL